MSYSKSTASTVAISLIVVALFFVAPGTEGMLIPPHLSFSRDTSNQNLITLECHDSTSTLINNAVFFRNETALSDGMELTGGQVQFIVTMRTEGVYSCSPDLLNTNARSNQITLITFPDNMFIQPQRRPKVALVGQTVQISCGISPGALLQHYFVHWVKSPARQSLYQTRPNHPPTKSDDRYSLNPSNLSLVISSVQVNDTNDQYHCELSVVDPNTDFKRLYQSSLEFNISLVVLDPPKINEGPLPQTVTEGDNVTFTCTATGSPIPTINWKQTVSGRHLLLEGDRYNISTFTLKTNKILSTLTIFQTNNFDSGEITCVASASVPFTYDTELLPYEAKAYFSVLGAFKSIAVRVSQQKDVIFDIELKIRIEEPLRLYIRYTDIVTGSNYTKVTSGMYVNVTTICHVEFDSEVKFDNFQVSVSLQSPRGVRGPLVQAGKHNKIKPTSQNEEMIIQQIPVIGGVSTATLVLLIICVVTLFTALLFKYLKMKVEAGAEKAQGFKSEYVKKTNSTVTNFTPIIMNDKTKKEIDKCVADIIKKHEASESISHSEMLQTFAGGLAYTLYSGLKHPHHRKIVDEIMTSIQSMAEAESNDENFKV